VRKRLQHSGAYCQDRQRGVNRRFIGPLFNKGDKASHSDTVRGHTTAALESEKPLAIRCLAIDHPPSRLLSGSNASGLYPSHGISD
jgi:hypothetical protein